MTSLTQIIKKPPYDVLDFINQHTFEQMEKFYHCSAQRQRLMSVFGEDAIKDADLKSFTTAYGLLGLANKAGSFQNPPQVNQDALEFLPSGLDNDSYASGWLIGAGINFALNIHDEETDLLEEVLKLVHQHNTIGNWSMDIDHLHSAIGDIRVDAQKITCDLANKTALDLFGEIAHNSIEEHTCFLIKNGYDDDADNFCLTDDDVERLEQCDLAILAIMRQNFIDYNIDININYFAEDVLALFMAVYKLFVKYQEKETVEAVRQAIAGVKTQPTEDKEHTMQPTRPTLNSANTLSTATLTNKALADKILSYAKENILADFVKLIESNADIYGEPTLSELVTVEVDNTEDDRTIHLAGENYSFVVHFAPGDYHHEKEHPSKAVLYIGSEVSELNLQNIDQYKKLGMDVIWNNGEYLFYDFEKQLDTLVSFFNLSKSIKFI